MAAPDLRSRNPQSRPRTIVLLAYEGVQSLDLVGPMEVFAMANRFGGAKAYEIILAAPDAREAVSNAGLRISGLTPVAELPAEIDTLLVAGGDGEAQRRMARPELLDWLRSLAGRTRRIGSICDGALVLAMSGLLDGRRATTHWSAVSELARIAPAVRLEADAIFVADPPFYSSAGVTAGMDLCLAFVEADLGPQVALAVARNLVLFMRRPGGQSQYSAGLAVGQASEPRLAALATEITAEPGGDLCLPTLAARVGMSERNFSRAFRREVGVTPARFVELARIDRAKTLLESSDWPLARVAERSGFGSLHALHRAFRKRLNATPADYRARFGRPRARFAPAES